MQVRESRAHRDRVRGVRASTARWPRTSIRVRCQSTRGTPSRGEMRKRSPSDWPPSAGRSETTSSKVKVTAFACTFTAPLSGRDREQHGRRVPRRAARGEGLLRAGGRERERRERGSGAAQRLLLPGELLAARAPLAELLALGLDDVGLGARGEALVREALLERRRAASRAARAPARAWRIPCRRPPCRRAGRSPASRRRGGRGRRRSCSSSCSCSCSCSRARVGR